MSELRAYINIGFALERREERETSHIRSPAAGWLSSNDTAIRIAIHCIALQLYLSTIYTHCTVIECSLLCSNNSPMPNSLYTHGTLLALLLGVASVER